MSELTPKILIDLLGLEPLEAEGGWFRQSYRSEDVLSPNALPDRYTADKPAGTAIYYLLSDEPGSISIFHRLPTDEVYHFYLGDPVELTLLFPGGEGRTVVLGQDLLSGQHVQFTAPAGVWQGSRLRPGGAFALLGTTMAPGFTDDDFEPARRGNLLAEFPRHAEIIRDLTRE
jgi:predicted cupin superfamily sugar epimerase